MSCKLCLRPEKLCRSHIVPEFLHKALYDTKHRARRLQVGKPRATYLQKGQSEELLCADCEQRINDSYEKPFCGAWRLGALLPDKLLPDGIHRVAVDYPTVKLFLLSVLFRAGVSTLGSFTAVRLGRLHEERLREMVLTRDPGGPTEYPIVGHFCVDEAGTILPSVASPIPYRLYGHRAYAFMFGGCEWTFFVSSRRVEEIRDVGIRADGLAFFGATLLKDTRTMRAMSEANARLGLQRAGPHSR